MAPPSLQATCLSDRPHDHRVSDPMVHFNGCLKGSRRQKFYETLPAETQRRILGENERITDLRRRLDSSQCDTTAAVRLRSFKSAMTQWCLATDRPTAAYSSGPGFGSRRPSGLSVYMGHEDQVNTHIKAPVMYFKDGHPIDVPGLSNHYPNQKVMVSDLLSEDEAANLIMQPCDEDMVRYFHLPANNMTWIEEIMARYYHESRPGSEDTMVKSKMIRPKTKTETLLRPEYWHGQQNFDTSSEVHARHMRPLCDAIRVDPMATDRHAKNLVLFMPYLHWETDRGRLKLAEIVKEAGKQKLSSIAEVASQAQHQMSRTQTNDTASPVLHPTASSSSSFANGDRRKALGQVLKTAAQLLEAMDLHTEEQLMIKYLHADPPLHPRRTLDQSYYGALKNTGTRDRDQVVYRGTKPEPHDCIGMAECEQCNQDIRKVPRVVMVDQLWLWILDEKTVITSFPRRWGKNKPDPSAIHKSLRMRLREIRPGEGIASAYDLALMIVDECSRVFFDRTKTNDRQPHLVELFTGAIRDLTYKQTAAFDQFLIYTHLASRDYKREKRSTSSDNSTQNTLLNINPEGNLLKEVKDIMDEIHIMLRIKEHQHVVMEGLVKNIRRALLPAVRGPRSQQLGGLTSVSSTPWVVAPEEEYKYFLDDQGGLAQGKVENARRTLDKSDHLINDLEERISELRALLENAQNTSAALKDLLTLKQQQAGVIEAREAVKQAQLTLKQGQSIMIFTIVTIIFLPLSFCVGFFGMNANELNDGRLLLTTEIKYMLPISAGIILVSFLFAFSQTVLSNSIVMLARSAVSFAWNTMVTWFLVTTGLYMAGREMSVAANRLRDREAKITGGMKAEVLRKEKNLERMRAAGHVKRLTGKKENDNDKKEGDDEGPSSTALGGAASGRCTPFSPYLVGGSTPRTQGGSSPFFSGTSTHGHAPQHQEPQWPLQRGGTRGDKSGLGVRMEEIDVELGERIHAHGPTWRGPSPSAGVPVRHQDSMSYSLTPRKMTTRQLV
ncbi:magnesium transport protein cora [Rhypophila decipiens]